MDWFGPEKRIEIAEQTDGLLIQATGIRRSIQRLIPTIFFIVFCYFAWRDRSWIALLLGVFGVFGWLWKIFRNESVELRVNESGLDVKSYSNGSEKDNVRFRWLDFSGLEYRVGGEDEPGGLYARTGRWSGRCLIEGLNKKQTEEIIAVIYKRFPYVAMAEDRDEWSLFGGESGLTTLDLSKPKK